MYRKILVLYLISFASGAVIAPTSSGPSASYMTSIPSTSNTQLTLEPVDCTDVSSSSAVSASCWNLLGMQDWMYRWNALKNCKQGEIWSSCFLNLAFEGTNYDCSMLGSLNCTAPELGEVPHEAHAFYGAYNIWGMGQLSSSHFQGIDDLYQA